VDKGYLIGPFITPPFKTYRVSPIGLVEKKFSSKKRLIVDLSAPREHPIHPSINSLISKDECSLSYVRIDDAISIICSLGQRALLCKTDITDAFKQLPIAPHLWNLYGIKWQGLYFFHTRLPFGSRSSPRIFDNLSQALCWIAKNKYGISHILHLLDDYLTIDPPTYPAQKTMNSLLMLFNRLNIPLSASKTCGPSCQIEYLGIILDTVKMEARLPLDKLKRISTLVATFMTIKSCTKRQLLSLLGHMVFATRVIVPGRTFMSRLFAAAYQVSGLEDRITLSDACTADLKMWSMFLSNWNGISLFLDNAPISSHDLKLFTDACTSVGYGGYFQGEWFAGKWTPSLLAGLVDVSMAFMELYPIVVAALLWGNQWARKRIMFCCDNEATVYIINKGRSPCTTIMRLMRRLVIVAASNNFSFTAKHIPGSSNNIADALSRFQFQKFRSIAPSAATHPCPLPSPIMLD